MAQQGAELERELGGRLAAAREEGAIHSAGEHAHEWETSPWPLTISAGILLALPLAFAFKFVYGQPLVAVLMLGLGTPLIVAGVVGWIREGLGAHELGLSPAAMPWFILAEALIFLSLFASYWVMRLGAFLALLLPALRGRVSEPFVKSASMYWHFVDIVWLFVVSQVYFW